MTKFRLSRLEAELRRPAEGYDMGWVGKGSVGDS